MFPLFFILLPPSALTLLAWRSGIHAIANGGESKTRVRARVWPAMLLLACPVVMLLGFLGLRSGHIDMTTRTNVVPWMLLIGVISSVSALVASIWAPRDFRPIALFASAAWVVCFGLTLMAIASLSALR
jgi:hypothetical protein